VGAFKEAQREARTEDQANRLGFRVQGSVRVLPVGVLNPCLLGGNSLREARAEDEANRFDHTHTPDRAP